MMRIHYDGFCRLSRGSGAPFEGNGGALDLEVGQTVDLPWQDTRLEIADADEEGASVNLYLGERKSSAYIAYNGTKTFVLERAALHLEIQINVQA